jgi:hypothetical protein
LQRREPCPTACRPVANSAHPATPPSPFLLYISPCFVIFPFTERPLSTRSNPQPLRSRLGPDSSIITGASDECHQIT